MRIITSLTLLFLFPNLILAQQLNTDLISSKKNVSALESKIVDSLNGLFLEIQSGELTDKFIEPSQKVLSKSMFSELSNKALSRGLKEKKIYQYELINFYKLNQGKYSIKIAVFDSLNDTRKLRMIYHFVASHIEDKIYFSLPLEILTEKYSTKTVGKIKYHFLEEINEENAKNFNQRNNEIADNFGLESDSLDFYMCDNYQDVLKFLGFDFDRSEVGVSNNGYGVDGKTIFSIRNNEDFSHDVFHYYSGKVNKRTERNWVTEEGVAYYWGNAFYVDSKDRMIELDLLVTELKKYLVENSNVSLLDLFENDTKIFNHICKKVSLRSTISGVICKEVEDKLGMEGLQELITCGRRTKTMENYFNAIQKMLGISKSNFDIRMNELLANYN